MRIRMMMAVPMLAAMPAGCGEPPSAEEVNASTIANCERQWSRMGGPAGKGADMCRCIVNEAANRGLEMTDIFSGSEAELKDIAKSCAAAYGP
jgi:hypothetical protein